VHASACYLDASFARRAFDLIGKFIDLSYKIKKRQDFSALPSHNSNTTALLTSL